MLYCIIEGGSLPTLSPVESNSTESLEKIYMEAKKFHVTRKKSIDKEALFYDLTIGETIERVGTKIAGACLFYDLTPGGDHDMCETFAKFIDILFYCKEKNLYAERDRALKVLKSYLTIE